jgi:hypothetical protein
MVYTQEETSSWVFAFRFLIKEYAPCLFSSFSSSIAAAGPQFALFLDSRKARRQLETMAV